MFECLLYGKHTAELSHVLFSCQFPCDLGPIIIFILQTRNLKNRRIKELVQSSLCIRGKPWDLNPVALSPEAGLPTLTPMVLKLAGVRITWRDCCLHLPQPPAEIWEFALISNKIPICADVRVPGPFWDLFPFPSRKQEVYMNTASFHFPTIGWGKKGFWNLGDILNHAWSV